MAGRSVAGLPQRVCAVTGIRTGWWAGRTPPSTTCTTSRSKVRKLVSIEGMGLRPMATDDATPGHERLLAWVENLRQLSGRIPKRYPTLKDAFERMQQANPHLTSEQVRHLTIHGSNQKRGRHLQLEVRQLHAHLVEVMDISLSAVGVLPIVGWRRRGWNQVGWVGDSSGSRSVHASPGSDHGLVSSVAGSKHPAPIGWKTPSGFSCPNPLFPPELGPA